MKIQPPGAGGAQSVLFDLGWKSNPGRSLAYTVFEMNTTNYGLTGWVGGDTIARYLTVKDESFESDYYSGVTSFRFNLTDDRGTPITGLKVNDLEVSMKPLGSQWQSPQVKTLKYVGAGVYSAEVSSYFTLQGLQKNVSVVTPGDRIHVASYVSIPPAARVTLDSKGISTPSRRGTINFIGRTYTDFPDDMTLLIPPSVQRVEFTPELDTDTYFQYWELRDGAELVSGSISDRSIFVRIGGDASIISYYSKTQPTNVAVSVTRTATDTVEVGGIITVYRFT